MDLSRGPSVEFPGKIVFVDPEIDPVNAQVHLRVEVVNQGLQLRPGMRARMQLEVPRKSASPTVSRPTAENEHSVSPR